MTQLLERVEFTTLTPEMLKERGYLNRLAELRMTVFREFPYLYDGDVSYESSYLKRYVESPNAVCVIARDRESGEIIGASTGNYLPDDMEEAKSVFTGAGHDASEYYYFGESILLPKWRGQGIGKRFFAERERAARKLPQVKYLTFCGVDRSKTHPEEPEDYRSPKQLWKSQGFVEHPELVAHFSWKDLGASEETAKPMIFWVKALA